MVKSALNHAMFCCKDQQFKSEVHQFNKPPMYNPVAHSQSYIASAKWKQSNLMCVCKVGFEQLEVKMHYVKSISCVIPLISYVSPTSLCLLQKILWRSIALQSPDPSPHPAYYPTRPKYHHTPELKDRTGLEVWSLDPKNVWNLPEHHLSKAALPILSCDKLMYIKQSRYLDIIG